MKRVVNMDLVPCPLCDFKDSSILFDIKTDHSKFYIIQCRQCNLARTFPMPDDDILDAHSESHYYGEKKNKFLPILQHVRDRLSKIRVRSYLSKIPASVKRPKILDIGCAEGRLLKAFYKSGCDCYGVEHSSYPEKRFINPDKIKYFVGDLKSHNLKNESFNIIILWHVLEHLDNPNFVISNIYDLLTPDGILILAVPNMSATEARVFKQSWFHLDVPWHKYHFTKNSLQYVTEKNKFKIVKNSNYCIEQSIFGLLQSVLNNIGWPRNELYEAMKGNIRYKRIASLFIQSIIGVSILIPCFIISSLFSRTENGSVLRLILRKNK